MSKRNITLILIGIIILSIGLRLYGLDRQSLWFDELAEENAFQRQFLNENEIFLPDTPPFNLFFISLVTQFFPGSDFALRMVPFTFGVISIPLFFLLGRKIFNDKIGLIAAFLLAISPFHIWYSQEARMYSLLWMLALISMIFFINALHQPNIKNFTGYIISNTAGLYTNQFAVFLLVLQALYLLVFLAKNKPHLFKWVFVFGIIVLSYIPWIIHTYTSLMGRHAGLQKNVLIDFKFILYPIYFYCAGFSIGPSLRELHINTSLETVKPYFTVIIPLMTVYITIFVLGIWSVSRDRAKLLLLLLLLTIPILGVFALTGILPDNVTFNIRYTGISLFAFLLFVANGIDRLSLRKQQKMGKGLVVLVFIVLTGFSAYSFVNYQFVKKYHKDDFRGAVAYIKEKRMANDGYLCFVNHDIFNRYSKNDPECVFPSIDRTDKHLIDKAMPEMVMGKDRMWLVINREWAWPPFEYLGDRIKDWLDANYEEIRDLHKDIDQIANIRIYCYDLSRKKSRTDFFETK